MVLFSWFTNKCCYICACTWNREMLPAAAPNPHRHTLPRLDPTKRRTFQQVWEDKGCDPCSS